MHLSELGGASAVLHDGPERTRDIEASITLVTEKGENDYAFRLFFVGGDTLHFAEEQYRFSDKERPTPAPWKPLPPTSQEAQLIRAAESGDATARTIHFLLRKIIVHQFHNTSATARIRGKWDVEDSRWLKEDAANLAPFLYRLSQQNIPCFQRIVDTIRLILPFFGEFVFEPESGRVLLKWRERGTDRVFNASQAADGMLRVMALVSLLLQPEEDLPGVLILDEPELGLHPYAINIVGGLVRSAATQTQVILATQSVSLVDNFLPEDIVVVERKGRESTFRRLGQQELDEWIEDYSLSELWEKNVLGGRPV